MKTLVRCLRRRCFWHICKKKSETEVFPQEQITAHERQPVALSRCLLCNYPYANVSSLTRHVRKHHEDTFREPFDCPECQRTGTTQRVSVLPAAWSSRGACTNYSSKGICRPPCPTPVNWLLSTLKWLPTSLQQHQTRHSRQRRRRVAPTNSARPPPPRFPAPRACGTQLPPEIASQGRLGRAIARQAEPLCYGGRITDAVWLNFQIGQSCIPCHARCPFHQMAGFRSGASSQPSVGSRSSNRNIVDCILSSSYTNARKSTQALAIRGLFPRRNPLQPSAIQVTT